MHVIDVGYEVVSAARVDDRAGGVVHLGHVVNRGEKRVRPVLLHIRPCFVERAPADDRRVIEVARYYLHPLVEVYLGCLSRSAVEAPVAHLVPDHVSVPVGVVEEARLKDLLMQSRAVEAARHRELDVLFEIRVGRGRVNAVRIEALIKHEALEHRLSVQSELHTVERDASETEIALYRVVAEGQDEVVQSALSELPEVLFGELYRRGEASADAVDLSRTGRDTLI